MPYIALYHFYISSPETGHGRAFATHRLKFGSNNSWCLTWREGSVSTFRRCTLTEKDIAMSYSSNLLFIPSLYQCRRLWIPRLGWRVMERVVKFTFLNQLRNWLHKAENSTFTTCVENLYFIFVRSSQLKRHRLAWLFRYWLTPRDHTIMVKGKGEMQTYWCNPTYSKKSSDEVESTNPSLTNEDHNYDTCDPAFWA